MAPSSITAVPPAQQAEADSASAAKSHRNARHTLECPVLVVKKSAPEAGGSPIRLRALYLSLLVQFTRVAEAGKTDVAAHLESPRRMRDTVRPYISATTGLPMALHYRTCNLCEALCGLEIEHEGEEIIAIRGDKNDPLSKGHICPKAVALQDLHNDPDRLRQPVKRVGDKWEPISWREAIEETASRLVSTQQEYGKDSVGFYAGNPTVHNHGALLFLLPFVKTLRTRNRYSATSVDQLPHMLACLEMFGNQGAFPIPDIDNTDFFLVLGANPMASNGSLMAAPDIRGRIKALHKRGGKLVVVDPRRTETAALADQHVFVRPGTDVFLLLAMLQVLFAENKVSLGHLGDRVRGFQTLAAAVKEWTPERVASICGIEAPVIRQLALDFAAADKAAAYCRVGTCTSDFGSAAAWLVYVLNIVTNNFDRQGGIMFTQPAFDVVGLANLSGDTGSFDRYRSRVRGLPEFGGEYPVTALAEEILTPGDGQVKAMVTHAGNPVLSCPDGQKLDQALGQLDFMVSVDFYINETTRHADIILPPTGQLEHAQFDPVFQAMAVRNMVKFSPPLFAKPDGAMHDWQILIDLMYAIERARGKDTVSSRASHRLLKRLGDEGLVDLVLRLGPYGSHPGWIERPRQLLARLPVIGKTLARVPLFKALGKLGPWSTDPSLPHGLTLSKVKESVHGIDLGPLRPGLENRVVTRDGAIDLMPERYAPQLAELAAWQPPKPDSLLLIGRRHVRSNNSWMHNSKRLVKGKNRCNLMLHPLDADRLGINEGQLVRIKGDGGEIELPATVSEDIMPGVVSAPHGYGHGRDGVQLSVASAHAGASINDVIGNRHVQALTGMAVINGVPVEVSAG